MEKNWFREKNRPTDQNEASEPTTEKEHSFLYWRLFETKNNKTKMKKRGTVITKDILMSVLWVKLLSFFLVCVCVSLILLLSWCSKHALHMHIDDTKHTERKKWNTKADCSSTNNIRRNMHVSMCVYISNNYEQCRCFTMCSLNPSRCVCV